VPALRRSLLLGWLLLACGERADAESPRASVEPRPLKSAARDGLAGGVAPAAAVSVVASVGDVASPSRVSVEETQLATQIVLAAGGDVNFGRECGQAILQSLDYDPFAGLGSAWTTADARFVNLESQLSDQHGLTQSPVNRLIFTGPPGGADVLSRARVSLVSTANNHAWDYGKSALLETIDNLNRAAVPFAGTGRSAEEAYRPVTLHVKQLSIALFAVTQIWNQGSFEQHEAKNFVAWANVERLKANIEQARREHDFVIVSYHGGEEYIDAPVEKTRRFVKEVMALGVDAIIGHHPHVMQGIGFVAGRPVIYSLGNFVFAGHDERPWTKHSFFARLLLRKGAPPLVFACPIAIDGHRPRSLAADREGLDVERFRSHLRSTSTSVGGVLVGPADELGCLPVSALPPRRR
jgi:poly-gamma-glutamate capsule biosynthesis protein CapA/YwtB (metallophosphatase superfamily)